LNKSEVSKRQPSLREEIANTASHGAGLAVAPAVLFGLAALIWPNLTLASLVFLFGAYLMADGLLAVIAGLTRHPQPPKEK